MAKLKLRCLVGNYESTRALRERVVEAEGIEFEFPRYPGTGTIHNQVALHNACEVGEFNQPAYVGAASRNWEFTALPIFLHRRFRHGFIFINKTRGISKPEDLAGKRIGCPRYQPAACMWLRGILQNEYGVLPESIEWFTNTPEMFEFDRPANLRIELVGPDRDVDDMFTNGEVDGIFSPNFPTAWQRKLPFVDRLWPNYYDVEVDYYKRTGIFPIMHCTVIKREIVDKNPWVVQSLLDAFEKSKQLAYRRLSNPRVVPLVWYQTYLENEHDVFGSDPWEYGMTSTSNRKNIETICLFMHQQHISSRLMMIEELYPREALTWQPTAPPVEIKSGNLDA